MFALCFFPPCIAVSLFFIVSFGWCKETSLGSCRTCSHNFCAYCMKTYHGDSDCGFKEFKEILEEYVSADVERKRAIEIRYGKDRLKRAMEEQKSEEYLQDSTTTCPTCGQHVEKTSGCNKMTCSQCSCYFCYLCGQKLPALDPYSHFNRGSCSGLLFEGMVQNQDDGEQDGLNFDNIFDWFIE
eukprot:m.86866 g.86866  ORF g.86866 m.86866 type:complete len:184 (+) comp8774_c0_seq1:1044-1595(+)